MFEVRVTEEFGRGLYATRDIYANEIVEMAELLVLSPEDTLKVNQTDLQYYTFVYNEKQDCLVLGMGEIFNHSDTPNVDYKLVNYGGRFKMGFKSIRDIKEGEQLFINYTHDTKVDSSQYVNKNLL